MARYKAQDRHSLLLPVVLSEQIVPGSFAFALDYLVDNELDLSAMDAKFKNDEVGASAYSNGSLKPDAAQARCRIASTLSTSGCLLQSID